MGMSKGGLPGAGNLTVAIYALYWRMLWVRSAYLFRRVAFARFDLRPTHHKCSFTGGMPKFIVVASFLLVER